MLVIAKLRAGPSKGRQDKAVTFGSFRRLLGYVWPHKRYLIPAILCILLMAATYSASIGSVLPVLTVLLKPQGLHGWVDQQIAQQRLRCELAIYDRQRQEPVAGVPDKTARVQVLKDGSPMLAKGEVHELDFILAVNGVEGDAVATFAQMAEPSTSLQMVCLSADGSRRHTVRVAASPPSRRYSLMRQAVALIPRGQRAEQRWWTLFTVLMLLLGVVLVGNLARVAAEYLAVLINARAVADLRREMYGHVLNLPLSRFTENTSDTMSKFVQDMGDILRGLNNFFEKVVTEPFKAGGAVILALCVNWRVTLVAILVTPVVALLIRKLGKRIRRANRRLLVGYGQMLGRLESTLTGMRVVKGYTRENYERRRLFRIERQVIKQQLKMGFVEALTSPFIEMLAFVTAVVVILYFAMDILEQPDRTPEFMWMLLCLLAIFDPVRKLSTVYPKLQRANAAAQRIFEVIDSPSEYAEDGSKPRLRPLEKTITFEHVTFTYPNTTRPAVRDVCLTVRKGETVALVGPNGSGKTTLVSLLPRFFPVDSGCIRIDGQDINQVKLRSLRQQFSLITQESVIFPDTIAANIAYGRPDASMEEIREAARKAFADEFIQQLPEKYETVVGEHGATLSGGQRQRIAIARAILRDAPILLFDEATSQVDPESEMKIHQALEAFLAGRTAFVIAHRFSTIAQADRIVVMDDGQVVAVGTHEQLFQSCPLYQRLYETQLRQAG